MDAFWQFWNSLTQGVRDNIVGGLISALTVIGVVGVCKMMGFSLLQGARGLAKKWVLRGEQTANPTPPPTPQTVVVKVESSYPPPLLAAAPKIDDAATSSPVSLIPRPPAVGFVARRDTEGREILVCLKEALAPEKNQLMALCGAGGVGKTTLAAESARALSEDFAKRVAWVSADGRPDFALSTLLDEIAGQLGHPEVRPLPPEQKDEQLRALVAFAPTLIVLDNFETIAEGEQARCADWLANRASCSAVITSRDDVPHARPVNIAAMSMPEAQEFVGRLIGQSRHPQSFKGLPHDEIISAADRNPLVLQWIIKQIDQAKQPHTVLDELAQGKGDAAARVFGRSFNLLNDDGRAALLALSLFVPSASRQALAEVAGFGKDSPRLDAAAAQLAELWLANPTEGNERLTVEGLTRELAKSLLSADSRAAEFRQRFVAYFQSYAEHYKQATPEHFDALEAERDNLLSAVEMAVSLRAWVEVMELVGVLAHINGFLDLRGYWNEVLKCNRQAIEAANFTKNEHDAAVFSQRVGIIQHDQGLYAEARLSTESALMIYRSLNSEKNIAVSLHELGRLAQGQGELAEARRLYNESLEISKRLGNQRDIAMTLNELGSLALAQGELAEARRLYDQSLAIKKRLGNQSGIASTLHQLGSLAQAQGALEEARRLYDESLEISKRLGEQRLIATSISEIGIVLSKQGRFAESKVKHEESLSIRRKLGEQRGIAIDLYQLGLHAEREGNQAEAIKLVRESLSIFVKLKSPFAEIARRNLERLKGEAS